MLALISRAMQNVRMASSFSRCAVAAVALPLLVIAPALQAQDEWRFGGHAKYQFGYTDFRSDDVAALLGEDPALNHEIDLRLKADGRKGAWDFSAHYELLGIYGDTVPLRRALVQRGLSPAAGPNPLPDDRQQLFDLTSEVADSAMAYAVQRLDRLSVGHTTSRTVVRFGRQAVSWGSGLAFQVLDFVNPFSPTAIDKEYKTGADMLYAQWIAADRGDLQGMIVPRRDIASGSIMSSESSYALKWRSRFGMFDFELLGAQHYDDGYFGVGVVRSIGGAVWRLDVAYTDLRAGGSATSVVTNLDYSWTWFEKNMYGFVEYYRNGFGVTDEQSYLAPPPALARRIARGEVYTLARDNAALGGQLEITPLVNVFANLLWNLNDSSVYFQLRGAYDWQQNVQLMAGINVPGGARGTEYGGIMVPGYGYLGAGRTAYVRAAYYF